jgi:hypothetical protein
MKPIHCLIGLLLCSLSHAGTLVYELTASGSLDIKTDDSEVALDENSLSTRVFSLSIDNCSASTCLVDPGLTHTLSTNVRATRCRMDIPELGWYQFWEGDGTAQFTSPVLDSDVTINVSCDNDQYDVDSDSMTVLMDPDTCIFVQYPPNLLMKSDTYEDFNDGSPFGQSTNASFEMTLRTDEYMVLDSISLPADTRRRFTMVSPPTQRLLAVSTISISRCPGDFTAETAICEFQVTNNSVLRFSTRPSDQGGAYCVMEPDTDYYINYVHSPDPLNTPPVCLDPQDSSCTFFGSEQPMQ